MPKHLVIVESAGKIKKISEYLGSDYIIKASFGHCMDLDPNNLSIDIENNYKPTYIISKDKHKIVNELKETAKICDSIILAADNDREGEAIAWSLANLLDLKNPPRIIFTEITKKAIDMAIKNPIQINMDMVHAQQARRLLDRLVGYKISPILQKNLNDKEAKSAGRVQSVLVKIIKNKEDEINSAISDMYLKTSCELEFEKNKINCILMKKNEIYKFNSLENAKIFIKQINKNTIFKVTEVQEKISIRKPSPPFITSSLQQEASTKLKFSVKKTMDIAQKLYEGGHITYMRTDSPNLSQDAIDSCKKYIIENYGDEYSKPTNYSASNGAQEAHEAIRPTYIKNAQIESTDKDQIKLYNLIWKKTVASQMEPAKINVQTISIDTLNDNKSLLNKALWISIYESTIFDGFLKLYDNSSNDEVESEEKQVGKIEIKINDILLFNKLKTIEEYNKLPMRFNEANLVKFLEKNNIGRPSTYATIIGKIIDRNYVEIKDIDGVKKNSNIIELDKKFKIKELIKEVVIGKENKKIVPTELGIKITTFLETHFHDIMQIDFTSEFEIYLDKIADHKAKWYNVLDMFYKKFNSIVETLNAISNIINTDILLGINPETQKELFVGKGKYGPYIKYINDNDKPIYVSIISTDITLEDAIISISFPKLIGKIEKKHVELANGKYGIYIKYDKQNFSIPETIENPESLNIEQAKSIIETKLNTSPKSFIIKDKTIYINNGQFGYYLSIVSKNNKQNIPIPKDINIKNITLKNILEIIASKNGTIKS
jgi:DNA topoisomerase-1